MNVKIRTFIALMLAVLLTATVLFACDNGDEKGAESSAPTVETTKESESVEGSAENETTTAETSVTADESSIDIGEESESTTENTTETEASAETTAESVTETEEATTDASSETEIEPAYPSVDATKKYDCADGAEMLQFDGMKEADYLALCAYYVERGYSVYSQNAVGEAKSLVLTKYDNICTIFFNANKGELYVTESVGAGFLPVTDEEYEKICEVSVTQHYSAEINGMGYIILLEDGSLIVYDGGHVADAEDLYKTICEISPLERPYIRAWVMTHWHGDHYNAFTEIAQKYCNEIDLETVFFAPANGFADSSAVNGLAAIESYIDRFGGAALCPVHTGMSFELCGVKLEVLLTYEYVAKDTEIVDFNDSTTVTRIVNSDGSAVFLGDIGKLGCDWMVEAYGDGLKSDMAQVSHHGCETATAELYDIIAPEILFWPCNENLFGQYRGELVKQHLIESEYVLEHILHGYGTVTRPLSYKAEAPEYIDLFPKSVSLLKAGSKVKDLRIEDGAIKYEVADYSDPNISLTLRKIDTGKCNMIRLVVDYDDCLGSVIYLNYGDMEDGKYSSERKKAVSRQGTSDDGKMTLLVYVGDLPDFEGNVKGIRFDFGTEDGQTVEIYSVEMFYIDLG